MERWLVARSPLLLKLLDHVLGGEVEIDLGRQQRVMPFFALRTFPPEEVIRVATTVYSYTFLLPTPDLLAAASVSLWSLRPTRVSSELVCLSRIAVILS